MTIKKYYFITFRVEIKNSAPHYGREIINISPFKWSMLHKENGGDYSKRVILYSEEITQEEYLEYAGILED